MGLKTGGDAGLESRNQRGSVTGKTRGTQGQLIQRSEAEEEEGEQHVWGGTFCDQDTVLGFNSKSSRDTVDKC